MTKYFIMLLLTCSFLPSFVFAAEASKRKISSATEYASELSNAKYCSTKIAGTAEGNYIISCIDASGAALPEVSSSLNIRSPLGHLKIILLMEEAGLKFLDKDLFKRN
jgi:hypothetical protein